MSVRQDGEASVEEILESIKKVIARDNRDEAIEERRRRAQDGMAADADEAEDVLELGEAEIAEEPFDSPSDDVEFIADTSDEDDGSETDSPLIAANVRESMQANFSALSAMSQPSARPQIVRSGETSLEGLTRDLLRPMLAEWLDANLPDMVERMVKAEIARIAGKRG